MLHYINFHNSASSNGNNGKNHEAVLIKYLVQQIKTWRTVTKS